MRSKKRHGSLQAESTQFFSKEFPKHWGANLHRLICPSDIRSIWNAIACLLENQIFLTMHTQPNGSCIWLFRAGEMFAMKMAPPKPCLAMRLSSGLTNRIRSEEHTSELQSHSFIS